MTFWPGLLSLRGITLISVLLVLLWPVFTLLSIPALAMLFLLLGILGSLLAYFLYAVRCWQAGSRFLGVLMLAIPLFVLTLAGGKVDPEVNFWLYVFFLFLFSALFMAIPVAVVAGIATAVGNYLSKTSAGRAGHRRPALPLLAVGLVLMTVCAGVLGTVIQAQNAGTLPGSVRTTVAGNENPGPGTRFTGLIPAVVEGISRPVSSPQQSVGDGSTMSSTIGTGSSVPSPSLTPDPAAPAGPYHYLGTGKVSHQFVYYLRGTRGTITLPLYAGVYTNISQNLWFREPGAVSPRGRHYDDIFDNPVQEEYLRPLVMAIRNSTPSQDDQVRIAISLVQHIPYDSSRATNPGPVHAPYVTLYDRKGVCQDKSVLLAYLLQELGYDTALMTFVPERHMTVGIRVPPPYDYRETGYAFVETTVPSIPTFVAPVPRLESAPNLYRIEDGGYWFDSVPEEAGDARSLERLVNQSGQGGFDPGTIATALSLVGKYGL